MNSNTPTNAPDLESPVSEQLKGIASPVLWPIGKIFLQHIHDLQALLEMPRILYSFTIGMKNMWSLTLKSVATGKCEDRGETLKEIFRRLDEFVKDREGFAELMSRSIAEFDEKILTDPSYGPRLVSALQALRSAVVATSWTAVEFMATDCWVAAINASPIPLAQRVLAALPEEPGSISSKQIPVGLAAKYNFDLRNCLGTVLRPKFDFTSVSGIRKAFSAAFTDAEALVSVLGDELLSELEVTRHLIVHRASVIDDEYNRRTSANARVGSMLELSEHKVHQFAECAAINGIAILLFVDDWLKTNAGRTLQKS